LLENVHKNKLNSQQTKTLKTPFLQVLINQSGVAKLADFGASSFKPGYSGKDGDGDDDDEEFQATAADQSSTLAGTPYFMSPEVNSPPFLSS
jgi:serine/threonine protein kinase